MCLGEDHSSRPAVTDGLQRSDPGTAALAVRTGRPRQHPYSSSLREGFASPPVTRQSRVGSYPTFSPLPLLRGSLPAEEVGRVFSVALSLGLPPVAVSHLPALWSPDFPLVPALRDQRSSIHLWQVQFRSSVRLLVKEGLAYSLPMRILQASGQSPELLSAALDAHAQALRDGNGVLKDGVRAAVTRVECQGQDLCVKEYQRVGVLDLLKSRLRAPRALRAWRAAAALEARGVSTPERLAVVERAGKRFLLTRFVAGAVALDRLLTETYAKPRNADQLGERRELARALGVWMAGFHASGIYHDDCSAKNLLVAGHLEFQLLDLDSVSPFRRLTYRRRVKNLSQLIDPPMGLSRTDQMRLLRAYVAISKHDLRRLSRDVAAAAKRRADRRSRRLGG